MPAIASPPPVDQKEYWNSRTGEEWATQADLIDGLLAPFGDAAMAALSPMAGETILDIGCGSGATSLKLASMSAPGGRVVGVDLSAPLLDRARARQKAQGPEIPASFFEIDAGRDPLPHAPFDAAFSRFGVMFFDDPAAAFSHIRAAMKPGGRLAFACWQALKNNQWALVPIEAAIPLMTRPVSPPDPHAPGPFAFADEQRVNSILSQAGWSKIMINPVVTKTRLPGGTVKESTDFAVRIGPLTRLIKEQEIDPEKLHAAVQDALAAHQTRSGEIWLEGAIWVVTAVA